MPDTQVAPIKARVIRIVKLDTCGVPVTGASSSMIVIKGFTETNVSPDYEEGEEFLTKLADGTPCVNQKDASFLKRAEIETHWCILSPDTIGMLTGERVIFAGAGAVTGTGVFFGTDPLTNHVSIELWQNVSGLGACDASGNPQYVYWAFPNVTNARIGDFTFENGIFDFVTTLDTDGASALWTPRKGAENWMGDEVVEAGEHFGFNVTSVAPPAVTNGAVALA